MYSQYPVAGRKYNTKQKAEKRKNEKDNKKIKGKLERFSTKYRIASCELQHELQLKLDKITLILWGTVG